MNGSENWVSELSTHLVTGKSSVILLHGNVRDVFLHNDNFISLKDFLYEAVLPKSNFKYFYDPQAGIQFLNKEDRSDFLQNLQGYDSFHGTSYAKSPPKEPAPAFSIMENISKLRVLDKKSVCGVINYLEHIVPGNLPGGVSSAHRYLVITLDKWAQNPMFVQNNVTIFIIAENLARVDENITRNAFIPRVYIPHPDEKVREKFTKLKKEQENFSTGLTESSIAKLTAGLSLVQMGRMFAWLKSNEKPLDLPTLKDLKRTYIEAECFGLLEFLEPKYNLSYVAGHKAAKGLLQKTTQAVKENLTEYLPMGYLICGPVGTGKTFLVNCFAGDIGIPVVKFLNFRSQWQGVTEANLEKIINLLKAAYPVVVMIDEADAFLGDRSASGDSGTSSRIFASLAAFMGDTFYRGKILWFLMTSRPDLLPIDMKRQGRAEEHIALFHTQNKEEEMEMFHVLAKKNKINVEGLTFSKNSQNSVYSGADIEAILIRSALESSLKGEKKLTQETLNHTIENFLSPNYPLENELQTLNAIRECTRKELIPEKYQNLSAAETSARIKEILALLGN